MNKWKVQLKREKNNAEVQRKFELQLMIAKAPLQYAQFAKKLIRMKKRMVLCGLNVPSVTSGFTLDVRRSREDCTPSWPKQSLSVTSAASTSSQFNFSTLCICISSCVLLLPPLSHYCRCEWVHFAASVLRDASNYSSTLDIPKHYSLRPQRRQFSEPWELRTSPARGRNFLGVP